MDKTKQKISTHEKEKYIYVLNSPKRYLIAKELNKFKGILLQQKEVQQIQRRYFIAAKKNPNLSCKK